MTKNKKKLRRAERRYSVSRTAQTLVLTGLLLAGGVGSANAANATVETKIEWDNAVKAGIGATEFIIVQNKTAGADVSITTGTAGTIAGGLKIDSGTSQNTALTLGADFGVGTTVLIQGDKGTSKTGSLTTGAFTFTAGGLTTIGDEGTLTVSSGGTYTAGGGITLGAANSSLLTVDGTVEGNVSTTGAKAEINLAGTIKGDVTLAGTTAADSKLTSTDDKAQVWGTVNVTKGTLSTATNELKIAGADGTGLGNVILGADSALTLNAGKALTLGNLTVNNNTAVTGKLNLAKLDGNSKLTLDTNGVLSFKDYAGNATDATLVRAATHGLALGTGGIRLSS